MTRGGLPALAVALGLLSAGPAWAQRTPLYQDGTATPHHIAKFNAQGRATDAGGVSGDSQGRGVAPFAITDAKNTALCANSDKTGAQYNALCLGHDSEGNPQITIDSYGGLDAKAMSLILNGTPYPFPFTASSSVVGPSVTTPGYLATYNNVGGTLLGQPTTALLDAQGLNIAKGLAPLQNNTSYAIQAVYKGNIDASKSSAALYTRNEYTGSDIQANPNGIYGTMWYAGAGGNVGTAVKGNFYTYTSSGSLSGSAPHQYFVSPNIGTLPIAAGVYGRVAHYLPGTLTYAAGVYADGIYNISTPVAGAITNFTNFLATAPTAGDAAHNYVLLSTGGSCSPNCYEATIATTADPLILKAGFADLDIRLQPSRRVAIDTSAVGAITGSGNLAALYIYYTAGAEAYIDAVSNLTSTSNLNLRTYAGSGVFNTMKWDTTGTLSLLPSVRSTPIGGAFNPAGLYSYMLPNAAGYIDALTNGSFSSELHLRTYNNGVFSDTYFDLVGRMYMGGYAINKGYNFSTLDTCVVGNAGAVAYVQDSTTNTWGAVITGGGSTPVLAFCNGATWTVAAK